MDKEEVSENSSKSEKEREKERGKELVQAAKDGDAKRIKKLIQLGVNVDYRAIGEDTTPLGHAARYGHLECVQLLLNNGAEVLAIDDTYFTPIHLAMEKQHWDVVEALVPSSVAVDSRGDDNTSVLHWMAAAGGSAEHIKYLLDKGADADIMDDEGRLAWEWAEEEEPNSAVSQMLKAACATATANTEPATTTTEPKNQTE